MPEAGPVGELDAEAEAEGYGIKGLDALGGLGIARRDEASLPASQSRQALAWGPKWRRARARVAAQARQARRPEEAETSLRGRSDMRTHAPRRPIGMEKSEEQGKAGQRGG